MAMLYDSHRFQSSGEITVLIKKYLNTAKKSYSRLGVQFVRGFITWPIQKYKLYNPVDISIYWTSRKKSGSIFSSSELDEEYALLENKFGAINKVEFYLYVKRRVDAAVNKTTLFSHHLRKG